MSPLRGNIYLTDILLYIGTTYKAAMTYGFYSQRHRQRKADRMFQVPTQQSIQAPNLEPSAIGTGVYLLVLDMLFFLIFKAFLFPMTTDSITFLRPDTTG